MKRISHLIFSATLACCAAAAQAGTTIKAADLPRISNGSTGYIGLTESAGMPRQPVDFRSSAGAMKFTPLPAGEASTVVNGRPNENPDAPSLRIGPAAMNGDHMKGELRSMGSSHGGGTMAGFPAGAHPSWGTPQ